MISRGFSLKKMFPKPWRRAVVLIAGLFLLAVVPGAYFALKNPTAAQASWFDTNWGFRKKIPITTHSSPETNVYFSVTVDTSDATKFQADCGDMRFTDTYGKVLKYFIVSGCGSGSTVTHVLVPTFPAGVQNFYMYYGNPSAANGFSAADFATAATVTVGSVAAEESGANPVAYWNFDEGSGTTAHDLTPNGNNGILGPGDAIPTWGSKDLCVSEKCLFFDGTNDVISGSTNSSLKVQSSTLSGWVKMNSFAGANHKMIASYANNITASGVEWGVNNSGYLSFAYNDGSVRGWYEDTATPLQPAKWYYVSIVWDKTAGQVKFYVNGNLSSTVTTTTGTIVYGSETLLIGYQSQNDFLNGWIDELRIYSYSQSAAQVRAGYLSALNNVGNSTVIGSGTQRFLSEGLVGYWKMDESSGVTKNCSAAPFADSSGNGNNGKSCPSTTGPDGGAVGKFGKAVNFDGSNDYIDVANTSLLHPGDTFTLSAWVKRSSTGTFDAIFGTTTNDYQLAFVNDNIKVSKQSIGDVFISTNTYTDTTNWHHIVAVKNGSVSTKVYYDGVEIPGTYADKTITAGSSSIYIGGDGNGGDIFSGSIDEARIYNRALSPQEVRQLYNFAPDAVGYWPLDEKTGSVALDRSIFGNTGTLGNTPVRLPGKVGNAVDFESSSSQDITVPDSSSLSITGNLTLSAWIKPESTTAATTFSIAGKTSSYWMVQYGDEIRVYIGSSSNYVTTNSTNLVTGTWYHVSGVYDANAQTVTIYVNGVAQAATTTGTIPASISDGSDSFNIGSGAGTPVTLTRGTTTTETSSDGFGTGNYTTSSFTPPSNSLLVVTVGAMGDNSTADIASCLTISDSQGLTWTSRVASSNTNSWAIGARTWTAPVTTGTSMTVTTSCGGTNIYTYKVRVTPYTGYNTSSPTGGTASDGNGPGDGSFTITLSGSPASTSEVLASIFIDRDNGTAHNVTPGTGWTEISDDSNNSDVMESQVRTGSTSTSVTWNDVQQQPTPGYKSVGQAVEINAGTSGGSNYYDGVIDDVKVYDYARSPSQEIEDMNGSHPLGGSPIGSQLIYAKLDEQTGSIQHNSGNGGGAYDATSSGPTWTSGSSCKVNGCMVFSTNNDVITWGDVAFTDSLATFSTSFWMNPSSLGTNRNIISKANITTQRVFEIKTDTSTSSEIQVMIASGSTDTSNYCTTAGLGLAVSTWQHLAIVYDGSQVATSRVKVYKNGKSIPCNVTGTIPTSFVAAGTTSNLKLGQGDDTINPLWSTYDEVKIYNAALTSDQVAIDYNFGSASTNGVLGTTEAADINIDGAGSNPVGYWNFDDRYGTSAKDKSGNNFTGTLNNGPKWVPGKVGSAISFDGVDDYVSVPDNAALRPTGAISVEFWVKFNTTNANNYIYNKEGTNTGYGFYLDPSSSLHPYIRVGGNWSDMTGPTAVTNQWYYISQTFDGTTHKFYINGVLYTSEAISGSITQEVGVPLWIGKECSGCTPGFYINGIIDDFKIYNYARTVGQIAYDYNRGAPLAWWKVDECQGSSLNDSSGNGSIGTVTIGGSGSITALGSCVSGTSTNAWYAGRTGKFNSALAIDGDDAVTMGNPTTLQMERTDPRTFSIWFKTTVNGATTLLSKQANSAPFAGYNLQLGGVGAIDFQLVNTYSTNTLELRTTTDTHYYDGNWHMATVTYDGSSNPTGVKIYFDGKSQPLTIANQSLSASIATSASFYLGSRGGSGQVLVGQIDDTRIYPYAMSANQVKKLYNDGAAVYYGPDTGAP